MIPTDLPFAIEASREMVPFPSLVEILIMESSHLSLSGRQASGFRDLLTDAWHIGALIFDRLLSPQNSQPYTDYSCSGHGNWFVCDTEFRICFLFQDCSVYFHIAGRTGRIPGNYGGSIRLFASTGRCEIIRGSINDARRPKDQRHLDRPDWKGANLEAGKKTGLSESKG